MKLILSRADAKQRGLRRYFTGLPCLRGHVTERSVSSARCMTCANDDQRKHYSNGMYQSVRYKQQRCRNARASRLKNWYGLTHTDYDCMVRSQNGKCAICQLVPESKLRVDHDHSTNLIRGLLCHHCNLVLGHAKDNPRTLKAAITYLETSERKAA